MSLPRSTTSLALAIGDGGSVDGDIDHGLSHLRTDRKSRQRTGLPLSRDHRQCVHGGDLRSVRYRHTGTVHFCVADMASAGGLRSERRRIGVLHSSLEGFLFVDRLFVPASCGAAASTSIHWLPSPEATPKKSSGLFTNAHWHTQAKTIDHCREPYAQPRGQQPDLIIRISQVRFRTARHGNRDVLVTVRGLEQTAHLAR
jgi:hypothetical protein